MFYLSICGMKISCGLQSIAGLTPLLLLPVTDSYPIRLSQVSFLLIPELSEPVSTNAPFLSPVEFFWLRYLYICRHQNAFSPPHLPGFLHIGGSSGGKNRRICATALILEMACLVRLTLQLLIFLEHSFKVLCFHWATK